MGGRAGEGCGKEVQFILILLFKGVLPTSPPSIPQERNTVYLGKAHSRASKELDSEFSKQQRSILGPANA